jgi:hypothetical protein
MKIKDIVLKINEQEYVNRICNIFMEADLDIKVKIAMHKIESQQDSIFFLVNSKLSTNDLAKD